MPFHFQITSSATVSVDTSSRIADDDIVMTIFPVATQVNGRLLHVPLQIHTLDIRHTHFTHSLLAGK